MILIDLKQSTQDIIVTVSELTTISNAFYLLVLSSDFNQSQLNISLTGNLSLDSNRYDLFQVNTSLVRGLKVGEYSYAIYQFPSLTMAVNASDKPIETGKAKVIDSTPVATPTTYNAPDNSSGFVTYIKK